MSDKFDEWLKKYRDEIKLDGPQRIKEGLASGRIANPHKVRAARFALDEHNNEPEIHREEQENGSRPREEVNLFGGGITYASEEEEDDPRPKKLLDRIQEHPAGAAIVFLGVIIVAVATVMVAGDNIVSIYKKYFPDTHQVSEAAKTEKHGGIIVEGEEVSEIRTGNGTIKIRQCDENKMPTLLSLSECDFGPHHTVSDQSWEVGISSACYANGVGEIDKKVKITIRQYMDFSQSKSSFFSVYIPNVASSDTFDIAALIANRMPTILTKTEGMWPLEFACPIESRKTKRSDLVFTGMIYLYHESDFSNQQKADLERIYENEGLRVDFRGPAYLVYKQAVNKNRLLGSGPIKF